MWNLTTPWLDSFGPVLIEQKKQLGMIVWIWLYKTMEVSIQGRKAYDNTHSHTFHLGLIISFMTYVFMQCNIWGPFYHQILPDWPAAVAGCWHEKIVWISITNQLKRIRNWMHTIFHSLFFSSCASTGPPIFPNIFYGTSWEATKDDHHHDDTIHIWYSTFFGLLQQSSSSFK